MPGLRDPSASRVQLMFSKLRDKNPNLPDIAYPCNAHGPSQGISRDKINRDDASSIGESEEAALNPVFLAKLKCLTWLEHKSLGDSPLELTASKSPLKRSNELVPYTPSASSTSTRCTRPREEESASPNSTNKRLGYRNPPRQIVLISGIDKENKSEELSLSVDTPATKKCLGLKKISSIKAPPAQSEKNDHDGRPVIQKERACRTRSLSATASVSHTDSNPFNPTISKRRRSLRYIPNLEREDSSQFKFKAPANPQGYNQPSSLPHEKVTFDNSSNPSKTPNRRRSSRLINNSEGVGSSRVEFESPATTQVLEQDINVTSSHSPDKGILHNAEQTSTIIFEPNVIPVDAPMMTPDNISQTDVSETLSSRLSPPLTNVQLQDGDTRDRSRPVEQQIYGCTSSLPVRTNSGIDSNLSTPSKTPNRRRSSRLINNSERVGSSRVEFESPATTQVLEQDINVMSSHSPDKGILHNAEQTSTIIFEPQVIPVDAPMVTPDNISQADVSETLSSRLSPPLTNVQLQDGDTRDRSRPVEQQKYGCTTSLSVGGISGIESNPPDPSLTPSKGRSSRKFVKSERAGSSRVEFETPATTQVLEQDINVMSSHSPEKVVLGNSKPKSTVTPEPLLIPDKISQNHQKTANVKSPTFHSVNVPSLESNRGSSILLGKRKRKQRVHIEDPFFDSEGSLFGEEESEDSYKVDSPSSASSDESVHENQLSEEQGAIGSRLSSKSCNLELAEMDDSDDERHTVPQKKTRKRKQNAKCTREEKDRKAYLRNTGQEYEKHQYVKTPKREARKRKPPHSCKIHRCQDIITDEVGDTIFHEYWEQGSYEKRVAYVSARVEVFPVKSQTTKQPAGNKKSHAKTYSRKYYFHIHGESKQVCKSTFLNTLDETDGFVRITVNKKLLSLSGTITEDKRGKHAPQHKLTNAVIDKVKAHILRFPSYKSHYKRTEVGDKRYLPSHLDIKQMYDMYISEGNPFVSYSSYERIFNTLGRSFKKPQTDTCQKCDTWLQILKEETDVSKREELEAQRDAHLDRAQAAYDYKKKMKEEAVNDPSLRVLVFDLEQVLETPLLSTGAAFYLRQLSTYNLTVYDTTTKITHCYMWCEVDGNRGANEIASCLYYHCLDSVPDTVKKIVLFSDSTTGQNRNSIIAAMFLTLVQVHASVASVEHVFLEVGHTRLEVDSKHSVIERKKKHADSISTPSDWYNIVRELGSPCTQYPSGKFAVVEMKGEFYDFQALLKGPLVLRQTTTTKEKFSWITTPLLRYDANRPGKVFFKRNLQELRFFCLDFQRSGKAGEHSAQHLQRYLKRCHHLQPLPISKEKKADLLKLLPLIPSSAHEFYKLIPTHAGNESEEDSSSLEIEESEED